MGELPGRFLCGRMAVIVAAAFSLAAGPASAQRSSSPDPSVAAVLAVADSALVAITAGDREGLFALMTPDAQVYSARIVDGIGSYRFRMATEDRNRPSTAGVIERGFDAEARVSGPIGVVWLPYDLYLSGKWSHCGVDVFTLVRAGNAWRIANLSFSIEQPPACRPHPAGPPPGLKAP